jgi:multicomponent K+:H+ antiporter subunit E
VTPSRLFPQPVLSVVLFLLWLLLNNTVAVGHLVLAALIAFAVPQITYRFWPNPPCFTRPWVALRLFGVVLWDIAIANVAVAIRVLGPTKRLRPAFIWIPLELEDEFGITVLASIISLTPGTVSVDVTEDRGRLLVHCLDTDDEAALIAEIKQRYERPLTEIFPCSRP